MLISAPTDKVLHDLKRSAVMSASNLKSSAAVSLRPVQVSLVRLKPEEIQMYSSRTKQEVTDDAGSMSEGFTPTSIKCELHNEEEIQCEVKVEEEDTWKQKVDEIEIYEGVKVEFAEDPLSTDSIPSDTPTSTANFNVTIYNSKTEEENPTQNKKKKKSVEYPCTVCKKVFSRKERMIRHFLSIHESRKDFCCDFCPQKFSAKSTLKAHIVRIHDMDAKPFACRVCNQRFTSKPELFRHNNELTEEEHLNLKLGLPQKQRRYNCKQCGKDFKWSYNLKRHQITHKWKEGDTSDLKLFKCELCDQEFVSKRPFLTHLKSHEDEAKEEEDQKMFNCDSCDKKFSFNQTLAMHSEFHKESEEKPFGCGRCEIRVATEDLWNRHLESEAHLRKQGELAGFKCRHCEKKFNWKHNCTKHELNNCSNRVANSEDGNEGTEDVGENADDAILGLPLQWNANPGCDGTPAVKEETMEDE